MRILVVIVLLTASGVARADFLQQKAEVKTSMADVSGQVTDQLKQFEQTKNPDALERASELIEGMEVLEIQDFTGRREARKKKLELWLSVLSRIDKEIDPSFDPADVPAMSITPPAVPGENTYSGMSPKDIKDPQARRKYEQALEKNQAKTARYSYQRKLMKLNERLSRKAEAYIKRAYLKSPESAKEVEEVVSKHIQNPARAAKLKQLVAR
jgi:hypothetical protein